MKTKKILSVFLSFFILITLPISAMAQEDIVNGEFFAQTIDSTVADSYNTVNSQWNITMWNSNGGSYVTYEVNTEQAAEYTVTVTTGTARSGAVMDISVNDKEYIKNTEVISANTENYNDTRTQEFGKIILKEGKNVIKFINRADSEDTVLLWSFSLKATGRKINDGDILDGEFDADINSGTISGSSNATLYTYAVTINKGGYVTYDVNVENEGEYDISVVTGTAKSGAYMGIALNDEKIIPDTKLISAETGLYNSKKTQVLGSITLKPGKNIIKFSVPTNSADVVVIYAFGLKKTEIKGIKINNFGFYGNDGIRVPYVVKSGMNVTAAADIKKGKDFSENLTFIIAEYSDDKLKNVTAKPIDLSGITDTNVHRISADITLSGEGGSVKAFLFKAGTITPVSDAYAYEELKIFPSDVLETPVNYQLATDTLNNDGVNYAEYGDHDDYNIDAIFYDGAVMGGKQTKVFAYLGLPQNASANSPVPAVICVHGGLGKAEISWVKKWNDIGFAAIAMDMYGNGPEDGNAYGTGKKQTPYAGICPWDDNQTAFIYDYRNAGMYQNVINIVNANTLLRSFAEIDSTKIGITGISWGGITTSTVIGVDNRLAFAAPIYGCGYLDQSKTYFGNTFKRENVSLNWDPANFIARADLPVMFVNSNGDYHFSLNATSLSYKTAENAYISIIPNLAHSQLDGQNVSQVYEFAKKAANGNIPYVKIVNEQVKDNIFSADISVPDGETLIDIKLYYITSDEYPENGGNNAHYGNNIPWQTKSDYTKDGNKITFNVPENATFMYLSTTDSDGVVICSQLLKNVSERAQLAKQAYEKSKTEFTASEYTEDFSDNTLGSWSVTTLSKPQYSSVSSDGGNMDIYYFNETSDQADAYVTVKSNAKYKGEQVVSFKQKTEVDSVGTFYIERETVTVGNGVSIAINRADYTHSISFCGSAIDLNKVGYKDGAWNNFEIYVTEGLYILVINDVIVASVYADNTADFESNPYIECYSNWSRSAHTYYDDFAVKHR